jgi:hypothetical protein
VNWLKIEICTEEVKTQNILSCSCSNQNFFCLFIIIQQDLKERLDHLTKYVVLAVLLYES